MEMVNTYVRKVAGLVILILINLLLVVEAGELTEEILVEGLQGDPALFEKIPKVNDGKPTSFEITLGKSTLKLANEFILDGIRFTAPNTIEGDFVWYFNAPGNWTGWSICPVTEKFDRGFLNYFSANNHYEDFDKAEEGNRYRILQNLRGDYFEPGKEYILFFQGPLGVKGGPLRGCFTFAKSDKGWNRETIEKALGLHPK